jgi:phytanoyl-CoA dioxygenase PhyH
MTMQVRSALWLDQPDAHEQIDARLDTDALTADEAKTLHHFVDEGYLKVSLGLDQGFCDRLDDEIGELWQRRPADLAVSPPGAGGPTSLRDYDGPVRERGYRIPDLHGYAVGARALYLHPQLFRFVELIFGEPALAFQSLYFEYGSTQGAHRDPMFVSTRPPLNMCAAWVALEDVSADSGPLKYVPGSHRLPWFEFSPGTIACGNDATREKFVEFGMWLQHEMKERGLEWREFTGARGDAFMWHAGLVHGGAPIRNDELTRKSFVVHYSTAADYTSRTARMRLRENGSWRLVNGTTQARMEAPGARGLVAPLHAP